MDTPSNANEPMLITDEKTGLPLIKCRLPAKPAEELTPERVAEILLAQEVEWFRAAGGME